jgi:hypothetical protein
MSSSWPSQGTQPGAAVASPHRPGLQRSLKGLPYAVRHSAAAAGRLVRAARAAVPQAPAAAPGLRAAGQAAAGSIWPAGGPSGHGRKPAASPRRRETLQLPVPLLPVCIAALLPQPPAAANCPTCPMHRQLARLHTRAGSRPYASHRLHTHARLCCTATALASSSARQPHIPQAELNTAVPSVIDRPTLCV